MRTLLVLASFVFALHVAHGVIGGYGKTRTRRIMPPKSIIRPLHKTVVRTETTISKTSSHKHAHPLPMPRPMVHPKPIIGHKPAVLPKDMMHRDPMMSGGPMMLDGPPMMGPGPHDGIIRPIVGDELPPHIRKLIGSTISGKAIRGGQGPFPEHGGAGAGPPFADGTRGGWGGQGVMHNRPVAVSAWEHPLGGRPWDPEYNGEMPLVFDPNRGMYVGRHHQAKKTGAMMGGPVVAEHNMVKEATHVAEKTIAGVGLGAPLIGRPTGRGSFIGLSDIETMGMVGHAGQGVMGHQIAKSPGIGPVGHGMAKASTGMQHSIGKARMLEIDPFGNPVGAIQHDMAKGQVMGMAGGMGGGGIQHDIAKSQVMGGMGGMGGGGIQHDIAKSQVMGGMGGHDIGGMGGMGGHDIQHDIAKSQVMGAVDPFGRPVGGVRGMQHNIVKATSGVMSPMGHVGGIGGPMMPPVQVKKAGGHPAHNVEKVIHSGIASVNHDDLAFNIGSDMARRIVHNSAQQIDMGSGGAVSAGSVIAQRAAHGLAKEAAHIAAETLDIASGNRGHVGQHALVGDKVVGVDGSMMAGGPGVMMSGGPGVMMAGQGGLGMPMGPAVPAMHMDTVVLPGSVHPKKPKYGGGMGTMIGGGVIGAPGIHPIQPMMEPIGMMEPVGMMEPMMPMMPMKPPRKMKVPKYKKGGYSRNPGKRRGRKRMKKMMKKARKAAKKGRRMRNW